MGWLPKHRVGCSTQVNTVVRTTFTWISAKAGGIARIAPSPRIPVDISYRTMPTHAGIGFEALRCVANRSALGRIECLEKPQRAAPCELRGGRGKRGELLIHK